MLSWEAMACGLPAVAFDCPSGPRDVIRHKVNGLLVPPGDVEALAGAMSGLMADEVERRRLGSCAPEVVDRFSIEQVMRLWDDVLTAAMGPESSLRIRARCFNARPAMRTLPRRRRKSPQASVSPSVVIRQRSLATLDDTQIQMAEQSLRDMLEAPDLIGTRFLDVGSGSGPLLARC